VRFEPHPKQRAFYESNARFCAACAGVRGGKTASGAARFVRLIARDHARVLAQGRRFRPVRRGVSEPLLRLWVGAPDYGQTRIAQEALSRIFEEERWDARWGGLHSGVFHECEIGRTGILIEFKSGEKPSRLVGRPTHGQWWDEAAKLKREVWALARQRLIDTGGWAQFTTTPMAGWFHAEVFQRGLGPESKWYDPTRLDGEFRSFHWTTRDNPKPEIQEDIKKAEATLPARYVRRDVDADPDTFFGQVWEEFEPSHICDDTGPFDDAFGGVDFGHGVPGAVLDIRARRRFDPKTRQPAHRYHVARELYGERWVTDEWTSRTKRVVTTARPQSHVLYCDPAGAQLIADWRNAGLPTTTHPKINDVSGGIKHVASLFKQGRLTISPSCVNLIREIKAYRYRENNAGDSTDEPIKANDHACFPAGTPVRTPGGWAPIETVAQGAAVLSLDPETQRWTTRLALGGLTSPDAEIVEVITERGAVRCTPDHPFLTTEGWRRADALAGQTLLADPATARDLSRSRGRHADASGLRGAQLLPVRQVLREQREGVIAALAPDGLECGAWADPTGLSRPSSGRGPDEQPSRQPRIEVGLGPSRGSYDAGEAGDGSDQHRCDGRPCCSSVALDPRGAGLAFQEREGRVGDARADCVDVPGMRRDLRDAWPRGSSSLLLGQLPSACAAQIADDRDTPARRGHVSYADPKGALCELAQTGAGALPVAFVRVLAVRSAGRVPVYGLTVMGTRNYVAAGFVVANCDALRYALFADHLRHAA